MKNLVRAAAILSGVVGLSGVVAALAVGCGGDDTVIGYPGDGGFDASVDSSSDTSIPDAGSDAFTFDAGPTNLANFYHQIDETGCAWLENCCGGPTQFQVEGPNGCVDLFDNNAAAFGFDYTRPVRDSIDGGGNVTFDPTKAAQCLTLIQNASCTVPYTSAQAIAIRDACYGAIQGNIAAGNTGCTNTIECAAPAHCDLSDDGGTCVAPLAPGAPCLAASGVPVDSMNNCGRAYTGEPGNCEVGGNATLSEAGTCQSAFADGTLCFNPFECASEICDSLPDGGDPNDTFCMEKATYTIPQLTCTSFPAVDAGDGG